MKLTKNKLHQLFLFFILIVYCVFNSGNKNLIIQINFILIGLLFLFSLKDKNYKLHFFNFYFKNQKFVVLYIIFLLIILFQTIPLPIYLLTIFSHQKYIFLDLLSNNILFSSISLSPTNTFFQFLNYLSLILFLFIVKMIFYRTSHVRRFFIFLSSVGALFSIFAIVLYLFGNPDVLFIKKTYHYKDSSTGFFINRTVFSIFLLFCLLAALEIQKYISIHNNTEIKDNFFLKIYTRFFIVFITLGILTSFSRIGNFLMLITIISYLIHELKKKKNINFQFRFLLYAIIIFDIVILGIFFGSSKLIERFAFINNEFSNIFAENYNLSRFQVIKFSFNQIPNFFILGYGAGGFETLFKLSFPNNSNLYADHAHSSIIEFFGEFGFIGSIVLILSLARILSLIHDFKLINFILFIYLLVLLLFDFSLHIPIIQILFIIFFVLNDKVTR